MDFKIGPKNRPFILEAFWLRNLLMPLKLLHQHRVKPPGPDLSAAPFLFGVVALTGYNGTSFPVIYELIGDWFVVYNEGDKCFTLQCKNIQR